MHELIERLEKATGPDRELDAAIALAIGLPTLNGRIGGVSYRDELCEPAPPYTASIGAALTLVPDGAFGGEIKWDSGGARAIVGFGGIPESQEGYAPTPALAICIAALHEKEPRP